VAKLALNTGLKQTLIVTSPLSRIGMMVAVGHTEMMLIGNGVTPDREDHVKIRFQHKGVLVGQRHCSMFMAISLQKITMNCKTTSAMDVTMRTMQSTSVMDTSTKHNLD